MRVVAAVYVLQGPEKGRTFALAGDSCLLGRHSDQVELNDHTVSRRHAMLERNGGGWRVSDLGSSNGTYVNGERVDGDQALSDGDQLKIGGTLLVFRDQEATPEGEDALTALEMIDFSASADVVDSSILSAVQADDSLILAAPETADAVHAWNLMYQLAEAAGAVRSVQSFLDTVADLILEHLISDRAFILIRPPGGGRMKPAAVRFRSRRQRKEKPITTSKTIVNRVVETKSGVLCTNATQDEQFAGDARSDSLENLALRSVICVPLIGHDEVHGVLHLDCPSSRHTYTHEQLRLATAIGKVVGLAIESQRLFDERMNNARLAAVGEAVAYLSHHIRNILQGLRGGADIVELGLKREKLETIAAGWKSVDHNLDRILHLTTNMLTFSKDRAPRIEFTQLNGIVEDAVDLARRQADEKGALVLMTLAELPPIPVDPEGIHQAVFNLIINGVAACPTDAGKVSVTTRFDAKKNRVSISVTDNGLGVPEEELERVFQPFHSSKGQGGTGLGLAASKKIVEELDGSLSVATKPGKGTRFVIYLPAERTTTDLEKTHGPAK